MSQKIYITGLGIVSALGCGVDETITALKEGRSGIRLIQRLETKYKGVLPAGEVALSNSEMAERIGIPSADRYSRTALLGIIAAREAWSTSHNVPKNRTGFISATSVGGIDKSEIAFKEFLKHSDLKSVSTQMISHDCGDSTERIADHLGINGFVTTISTACSSSSNAMILGARMIKAGLLDKVLVGGTDALTVYTLNGFNTLKIVDENWCRPFDQTRSGLNLGEGAAFLTLQSEESVKMSKEKVICELKGFGNTNDAFHQTASSPDGAGAFHAMKKALDYAGMKPSDIDYINAHGTATPNNDLSEGLAIKNLFKDYIPNFSSTKSYTGHTLAAAGSIEAVISILSLKKKVLFPNLNYSNMMEDLQLKPVTDMIEGNGIKTVLSNSFGFGGNCSALVFAE